MDLHRLSGIIGANYSMNGMFTHVYYRTQNTLR